VDERGGDDSRPEVVVVADGSVGESVTGVETGSDSSSPGCSRSLVVHVSIPELDPTTHLVTSPDFISGSS